MTPVSPVQAWLLLDWLRAPWTHPFLAEAGIPDEVLGDVGGILDTAEAIAPREPGAPEPVGDLNRLLAAIERRHGPGARERFDAWSRRAMLDESHTRAALAWSIVLARWTRPGFTIPPEHRAPEAVRRRAPEIAARLDPDRRRRFRARVEAVAPPGDPELGGISPDVEGLVDLAANDWTWRALDILRGDLDPSSRDEVLRRAEAYARALGLGTGRLFL